MNQDRAAYIVMYHARMRKHNKKATEESGKWEARKAVLEARALVTGWDLDSQKFRTLCDQDNALNDALQAWSWHEREAKRCATVIEVEERMDKWERSGEIPLEAIPRG